jgi:hypothetical protein
MNREERVAWAVALADGLLMAGLAVVVGRLESGDSATTPSFNRALPYAVAALVPLVSWVGRCHALALQQKRTFMVRRVLAVGAASGTAILLTLAFGPLLTAEGRDQLSRSLGAPFGFINTVGAFLIVCESAVVFAVIGMIAALWVAGVNWLIVDSSARFDQRSA